jgi:peptidoglycan-N-acetylglucosamine deacetylase
MRLFRPAFLGGYLYPEGIFRIKTTEKVLYLTFDDGPDPVSTPQLLFILKKFNIKAMFFCTGKAAEENVYMMDMIRAGGHLIGNHGYSHLDGWKTDTPTYINDVIMAADATSDKIFRPPFGRLSPRQKKKLLESYKLVFWDLMDYDFDIAFGSRKSLRVLKEKIRPGSIIVMHDTAFSSANTILDDFIVFANSQGYRFELLNLL